MRLTREQANIIRRLAHEVAGDMATIRLFGSRLDDDARGGDIDLLLEMPEPVADPALTSARLAGRVSRAMMGRRVDVIIDAPNLKRQPIHEIARAEGLIL